jgi:SAM-dependent methyltransferase
MDENTARALVAVNREFYHARAAAFDASRDAPWPGWSRVLEHLTADAPRVLDVGCGNGRFAAFLAERGVGARYLGVDGSGPLLAAARRQRIPGARFRRAELVAGEDDAALPADCFDLVAVFGLLHHVPGEVRRRTLLHALARRLAPGGVLALAFWRFGDFARFRTRILPPSAWRSIPGGPIDPEHLESGDHLLPFGANGTPRYCHHTDESECERLTTSLPLVRVDRYLADGREGTLNRYVVLRAASA